MKSVRSPSAKLSNSRRNSAFTASAMPWETAFLMITPPSRRRASMAREGASLASKDMIGIGFLLRNLKPVRRCAWPGSGFQKLWSRCAAKTNAEKPYRANQMISRSTLEKLVAMACQTIAETWHPMDFGLMPVSAVPTRRETVPASAPRPLRAGTYRPGSLRRHRARATSSVRHGSCMRARSPRARPTRRLWRIRPTRASASSEKRAPAL